MTFDDRQLEHAYCTARRDLLDQREMNGHWIGQLSASALSTATAVSALSLAVSAEKDEAGSSAPDDDNQRVLSGVTWLADQQNDDGGWGDTDKSYSNIATTLLVVSAVHLAGLTTSWRDRLDCAAGFIDRAGALDGLRRRYGKDRTFAVPILANAALAGQVPWAEVFPLPFEAAWFPQRFYRWLRLPVVSYAIPALVAIGQARFYHGPPSRWPLRLVRRAAIEPTLRVLRRIQPPSGGYLEAVPLTSFVVMSLVSVGRLQHPVVQSGLRFLRDSVRADGSWPIDTNLATWNTSLALNALAAGGDDIPDRADLDWLLQCQQTGRHPFTGAGPGGWGWSDLGGSVPDADDTAGALLALAQGAASPACRVQDRIRIHESAVAGTRWLRSLQNRDGGWPTFCRGWGKLPFDRSGADLTAHAIRALDAWNQLAPRRHAAAIARGWRYLQRTQRPDGSWVPLWFGNQDHPSEENPVYGTTRVLMAFCQAGDVNGVAVRKALHWLVSIQQPDGGWAGFGGGMASVEETALAVECIACCLRRSSAWPEFDGLHAALKKGEAWLIRAVLADQHRENAPIGFYFAKLWYYERLYPLMYTVAALGQTVRLRSNLTSRP